ncbi:IclR family transcriptional regulator [Lactonifactor longoviformis]|uniref:IclR family transcriptional regulator n=1 Tax=Lactonifactor longoviformis TaxID=341220 RepID=UPI000CDAD1C0|nr:IclR family transcriptional regulator [Lactonifactor longoviformis]POP35017.1 IclR family transcriptional regulator [Lactonifactor longoviformis]
MSLTENKLETIQAVDRAFQILETISRKGSMSLNDLHKELRVSKASLLRLAYTLVQNGYLDKNPQTGNYTLTLKAYEVGISSIQNLDKISLINSTLVDLSRETGRIAQFSVEDNNQLLCLQSIGQKTSSFSIYTTVGRRSPLYCTSAGKALLSAYTNTQIIEKWETFDVKALTEHTITDIHSFLQDVSETRRRHYALDREENEYHIFCVGAPVMGHSNLPLGAISVSGSSLTEEEEQRIAGILVPAVKRLSGLLGYVMEGTSEYF